MPLAESNFRQSNRGAVPTLGPGENSRTRELRNLGVSETSENWNESISTLPYGVDEVSTIIALVL